MKKRCEVCQIDLQNESSYFGHMQGKKHLKNAEKFKMIQSITERSIFVRRIPHYIPSHNIIEFFAQFGEIEKYRFGPSHLILEFKTNDPVNFLLSKPIFYSNIRLNICSRIIIDNKAANKKDNRSNTPEAINDAEDLKYDNVKSVFEVESTFDEQLTAFLDKVAISSSEIETRYELTCKKLELLFQSVFPYCKTYRFGSTVTALGFKNCDLDIYLDSGSSVNHENDGNARFNDTHPAAVFGEIKRFLFSRTNMFSKVVPIPKAKTPIIKFTYTPTNISCDISFKNSLAVHNSQLVKFYLSLDPRLRPTMMILKYWVSNYELRGGDKISKYALTLLFIFYLQQPHIKIVPPIIQLKRRCLPEIVEGWQVNFDNSVRNYQENSDSKDKTIPELLHGFFDFYANYNFKSNIICTIDGLSHSKASFNVIENLPESMDRYKEYLRTKENPVTLTINKPMCLQDPNELNHNVTGNICAKYLETFQKYCTAAGKICVNTVENNYRELLPSIFSLIVKVQRKDLDVSFLIYADDFLTVGLPQDFETQTGVVDKDLFIRENWYNLILYLIKKFFVEVLHLSVQIINSEPEQKQQKTEMQSDVHTQDQNKIVMHCTGMYCLWRDRKGKTNVLDPSLSLLEKEILLTKNIFEYRNSRNNNIEMKIDFQCHILKKADKTPYFILSLANIDCSNKIFPELAAYIKNKLPHVINKTLIHMRQFKRTTID